MYGNVENLKKEEENMERKLKDLLLNLFRFDVEDLDFGIYKIMNFKREEIRNFIENDLINAVEEEFKELYKQDAKDLEKELKDLRREVVENLGEGVFDEDGNINPMFENVPIVKKYKEKQKALKNVENVTADKREIFSRIYEFFDRYYQDGDLIPIRRYTKSNDYIVPYNGEEVMLYWANKDQYYVKTTEYFQKYTFRAGAYEINFKLREAHIDKNNVKGKDKYFILSAEDFMEVKGKSVNIYFEFRELTNEEYQRFGFGDRTNKTTVKTTLQEDAVKRINEWLQENNHPDIKKQLNKKFVKKSGEESDRTVLEARIAQYVAKNTKDYFIHKNLKKFFLTELDFYIKNEMLNMESIESMDENELRKLMRRVKVFRNLSQKIIEFLAEIEDFEKMLWEKKKFVLKTEYVITLDKIKEFAGEEFLEGIIDDILNNEKQIEEWKELFGVEVSRKEDLIEKRTLEGNVWKKLPIDTKYFDEEFKWNLLVALSKNNYLDDILDGVLIKSENWQALNLLLNKYYEKVQTIYIDPPFKTGKDFIYKDNYQTSSWLTLLIDRIKLAREFMRETGSFFIHLDWNANYLGRYLVNSMFPVINEIIWNTNATKDDESGLFSYKSFGEKYVRQHDTIFQCSYINDYKFIKLWKPNRNTTKLPIGWLDLISYTKEGTKRGQRLEDFEFFVEKYNDKGNLVLQKLEVKEKVYPIGDIWNDIYHFTQSELRTTENVSFNTQKPENLLRRILQSTTEKGDLVMDFFAGSGTTLVVSHKLRRKWIGIELEEYFSEFYHDNSEKKLGLLGRLKIVLYGDKEFNILGKRRRSHLSNDINWSGSGFFKYHTLEQYEDTLNNIVFANEEGRQAKLAEFEDYIFHMLEYGTRGSMSRLNIDKFQKPFSYKLRILENGMEKDENVDLAETFNYLLGLHVKKYFVERFEDRKYVWVVGTKSDGSLTVIVWRNTENLDLEKDKNHIEEKMNEIADTEPDYIYVNGDSYVENAIPIETEFMKLLGA
ncbi:adenine specific DNA methylase Mod [Aciduliprofundum sp. MAR08-339]|uniref:DNA methyltransferase n=1 Tax=Aciduliprofundum sp. (strain MAR08-339) TaxID=673860 RepID=UPI0002A4C46F|nr:adenine specific DNA methylase Mod [Aciduliprofundum sp. MAR08-339]